MTSANTRRYRIWQLSGIQEQLKEVTYLESITSVNRREEIAEIAFNKKESVIEKYPFKDKGKSFKNLHITLYGSGELWTPAEMNRGEFLNFSNVLLQKNV